MIKIFLSIKHWLLENNWQHQFELPQITFTFPTKLGAVLAKEAYMREMVPLINVCSEHHVGFPLPKFGYREVTAPKVIPGHIDEGEV